MSKSKDISTIDASYLENLAKQQMATEASSASVIPKMLSTRGGRLSVDGQPIVGDKIKAIILCAPIERLYYDAAFNSAEVTPPACSAIGLDATKIAPQSNSLKPQSNQCSGCPKDQWGSALNGGRGKGCRETRHIVFLDADNTLTADDVSIGPVYAVRPPVTSIAAFTNYVKQLGIVNRLPVFAVVTEISVVPDVKTLFKVQFNFVKAISDQATLVALVDRARLEQTQLLKDKGSPQITVELVADQLEMF